MIRSYQCFRLLGFLAIFGFHCREFRWCSCDFVHATSGALVFFFALSGFLMGYRDDATPFTWRNVWKGIRRRVWRFYPLYFICLVTELKFLRGMACLLSGQDPTEVCVWRRLPIRHLLMAQSWWPHIVEDFYVVGWFASTIVFLYLIGSIVTPFLRRWRVGGLIFLVVTLECVYAWLCRELHQFNGDYTGPVLLLKEWTVMFPPSRILEFVSAIALGIVCRRWMASGKGRMSPVVATALELAAMAAWAWACFSSIGWTVTSVRWIVPNALLLVCFVQERGLLSRAAGLRPLVWLGSLTMPMYFIHLNVINVMIRIAGARSRILSGEEQAFFFFLSIAVTIVLAWAYTSLFERGGWRRLYERVRKTSVGELES